MEFDAAARMCNSARACLARALYIVETDGA